ncbi:MAG: NADP-dependent malic enzyme [Saprospirales bacterium]|nr:MAG: NADP-dependent malic enzyme [Saprospirales bacterium]
MDFFKEALYLHEHLRGKIKITSKFDVRSKEDLSLVYSPGVAEPCKEIAKNPDRVWDYTIKSNTVAIVSDGSAVLGLGDIGPHASIPVMEGKAMLFKKFAAIDAFPICLDAHTADEIVETVKRIAPVFGGINLEDIAAPKSFDVEERLQDIGIPVFHDDQHGTAIVVLAGLLNAARVTGKKLTEMKIVINGAGAAGIAIAKLLLCVDNQNDDLCTPVREIILCDSKGVVHKDRTDLNEQKRQTLSYTNPNNVQGTVYDALNGADVFIGVSVGNLLKAEHIKTMANDAIVFALSNPIPEIMPEEAYKGGAAIVGTGRSDMPNQINNVLGFPGIFRGALDARAKSISPGMKIAAAYAIANCINDLNRDQIIPSSLNEAVGYRVAEAVYKAAKEENA